MNGVESEYEMRYLLLEKDFDNRDSLEIITRYSISEFLENKFAENVVREIWRSPYATNNSILSASTNHQLLFHYWHCVRDEEDDKRFYKGKNPANFQAHPLQFMVWRYSARSRILIEFCASFLIAAVFHYFTSWALSDAEFLHEIGIKL